MVTVARVTTEQEFQEVVTWWNYQREREIFHRWGYKGWTLDSMFPLPRPFTTRREESEAALRPYFETGEIWVCRGKDGLIHHVVEFQLRPDEKIAVNFWRQHDFDYHFTLAPEEIPADGIPPGVEDMWNGAPRESPRMKLLGDLYAAIIKQVVFQNLLDRGFTRVEFREVRGNRPIRRAIITRTPIGYDKWTRKQRYRVLLDLKLVMMKRAESKSFQDRLRQAEAL